ncbi:MAG: TetR/AcrR family transcriptional regulator [Bacteroidales bacterium]|nr:TetR/AcrR family transcriptional regulator [Bacteroidales bacterium]
MDQNLRTNIKKTAAKLFLKYGLRSVSIDDICNELHISKKTFYTQFSQKEALIESVLMEHNEKQLKKQENKYNPCQCEGNAIDQLMKVSEFHSSTKNDRFVNFFYDLNKYYPEIHKRMSQQNQEHIREYIRLNILTGIQENLFRSDIDIESMTRFLSVQFITVMNLNTNKINKASLLRSIEFVMDVYVRVLCNKEGLEYYENLLSQKSKQMKTEDEPLKDEELDRILDQVMNTSK